MFRSLLDCFVTLVMMGMDVPACFVTPAMTGWGILNGFVTLVMPGWAGTAATPCHCEERSDEAIQSKNHILYFASCEERSDKTIQYRHCKIPEK